MTTTGLTVVEWADKVGKGFAPYRTGGPTAAPEYWSAAQRLLEADVTQPPVRSTAGHPVWTLRHVDVGRLGGHWCFTVQGRGDGFGVAGTCRFAFAPEAASPADVWRDGVAAIGDPDRYADPDDLAGRVRGLLGALALPDRQIQVPGSPGEVATVVAAALDVLPRRVVAARVWATCLLQRPEQPVVAGGLPEEFRRGLAGLARQLDQVRWAGLPDADQLGRALAEPRRLEALDYLARMAAAGQSDDAFVQGPFGDVTSLLDHVAADHLTLTEDDVPALLKARDGAQRLRRQLGLVGRWAAGHPREALAFEQRRLDPDVRRELVHGLVEAQCATAQNLWLLPLDERPARLLLEYTDSPDARADTVRRLRAAHPEFASHASRAEAYPWLQRLGLSPWQHADLFPDRAAVIAAQLAGTGMTAEVAHELATRTERDPSLVGSVVSRGAALPPEVAGQLTVAYPGFLRPASNADLAEIRRIARTVTLYSLKAAERAEDWLARMLYEVWELPIRTTGSPAPRSARFAMYGALEGFGDQARRGPFGSRRIRDKRLLDICGTIGVGGSAGDAVLKLLPDSISRHPVPPAVSSSPATLFISQRAGGPTAPGSVPPPTTPTQMLPMTPPVQAPPPGQTPPPTTPGQVPMAGPVDQAPGGTGRMRAALGTGSPAQRRLVAGGLAVVALGAVGTAAAYVISGDPDQPAPHSSTTGPPAATRPAQSTAPAGGSTTFRVHLEPNALKADQDNARNAFQQQLQATHIGQRVATVHITGLARSEETGLAAARQLQTVLRDVPEIAGAQFTGIGWSSQVDEGERFGDLRIELTFVP